MKRICPSCNTPLEDNNSHFCLSCGHKLDDSLIMVNDTFSTRVLEFVPQTSGKKQKKPKKEKKIKVSNKALNKQLTIGFVAVVLIGILAVGVIYLTRMDFRKEKRI